MRARFRFFSALNIGNRAALSTELRPAAGTGRLGMVIAANPTGVGTSTTRVVSSRPPDRPFLAVGVRMEGSSTRPKCEKPRGRRGPTKTRFQCADTAIGSGEKLELSRDHRLAFPEEPTGCSPPAADRCPVRSPRASLHAAHPASGDPRLDRATTPPPGPPPHCRSAPPASRRLGPAAERVRPTARGRGFPL